MSFDSVMATINSGLTTHWYKFDDASGTIVDSGDATTRSLSVAGGTGSLTYEVTGSEAGGTSGKAISFPHDKSMRNEANEMAQATTFSIHIALKTINNASNQDNVSAKFYSIADDSIGTPECAFSANRNADGNGICRFFIQKTGAGTDTLVQPGDFPGSAAWDDNNWHYYAIVQRGDGTGLQVYIDGVLPTQENRILGTGDKDYHFQDIAMGNDDNIAAGSAADDSHSLKMEGVLDNLVWWKDYALTAQEVLNLFNEGLPPVISSFTRRTGRHTFNDALA